MKIIFTLIFLASMIGSNTVFAKCKDDDSMGFGYVRCENKEAVCYEFGHKISCFAKQKK